MCWSATSPSVILPNMQIDDYVFGVAAVDAAGHESFVTAYVTPPRASTDIKTETVAVDGRPSRSGSRAQRI